MTNNPMNAMLRRAAQRSRTTRTTPTAESAIEDVSAVAAALTTPTQLQQFRDALLDALDNATTTDPMGATR